MSYTIKFLLFGIFFGALFPITATFIESWIRFRSFALHHFLDVQMNEPLLLMIDTAPFFLGLFACIAGIQYDRLKTINEERKKLLQELEIKNSELEKKVHQRTAMLQRNMEKAQLANQAKSQFVAAVSHELRTPLSAIHGSLKLILGTAKTMSSDQTLELINLADNNCKRLTKLVDDLLDTERLESGKMLLTLMVQDLNPVLQQAIDENQPYAAMYNILLHLQPASQPLMVNIDKDRLIQVLTNIITNAVKFSPPNTTVEISAAQTGQSIKIAVKDQGRGISADLHKFIFEKFTQIDHGNTRKTGSIGLGLYIAQQLINDMHGSISYESQVNQGSVFFKNLPRVNSD